MYLAERGGQVFHGSNMRSPVVSTFSLLLQLSPALEGKGLLISICITLDLTYFWSFTHVQGPAPV